MFLVGIFSWWYGAGWRQRAGVVGERLAKTLDYFSFDLLIKTWFAPFRQISAGKVQGPLGVQFRAWLDRLVSRCIGGLIRTFVMIFGLLWTCIQLILGGVELAFWMLMPLLPLAGIILAVTGWVPEWGF